MASQVQLLWRPNDNACFAMPAERESAAWHERERHRAVIAAWQVLFPDARVVPGTDYEDWHENAAKLLAAIDSGCSTFQLDRSDPTRVLRAFPLADGRIPVFDRAAPCALVGTHLKFDPLVHSKADMLPRLGGFVDLGKADRACWDVRAEQVLWPLRGTHRANDYSALAAFKRYAGRRTCLCGIPCDGYLKHGRSIYDELVEWAKDGPVDALIKVVAQAKYDQPQPVVLPQGATTRQAAEAVADALDWGFLQLESVPDGLLLQDRLGLVGEYRFTVVDHKIATGAGTIEKFVPISAACGPFDIQLERGRNSGEIGLDALTVEQYVRFAQRVTGEIAQERPDMGDYTLDVAWATDGPVVIELNETLNFGLYAADYRHIVRAAKEACLRRAAGLDLTVADGRPAVIEVSAAPVAPPPSLMAPTDGDAPPAISALAQANFAIFLNRATAASDGDERVFSDDAEEEGILAP